MYLADQFLSILVEAVVFLRTLGAYKIPAVIEKRRQELLDKLSLLQGNTIKETPAAIEPKELQPTPPPPKEEAPAAKEREREESPLSASSSEVASPSPSHGQGSITRKDSKVVSSRIKDYEKIHFGAKKEEVSDTPKRFVQLKKVAKPTDFPANDSSPTHSTSSTLDRETGEESKEEGKGEAKDPGLLEVEPGRERAASVTSMDEGEEAEAEAGEEGKTQDKKKKKNKRLKVKGGKKRDKSPAPERKFDGSTEILVDSVDVVAEEGVKIVGVLERKQKKGLGGYKKVKLAAKVKYTTLVLGGKDDLELAHCSVEANESGFELMHPQHRSGIVFKVEGTEEDKQKWVQVLKDAIEEATPPEDKKEGGKPPHGGC